MGFSDRFKDTKEDLAPDMEAVVHEIMRSPEYKAYEKAVITAQKREFDYNRSSHRYSETLPHYRAEDKQGEMQRVSDTLDTLREILASKGIPLEKRDDVMAAVSQSAKDAANKAGHAY